jgi:hypothetical protein
MSSIFNSLLVKALKIVLFVLIFAGFRFIASAQDTAVDTTLYRIETRDGNEYVGKIISRDSVSIYFSTESIGAIYIRLSEIKSREKVVNEQMRDGEIWFANPQSTRYFWSPNGYGLKKGEGYYQNIWVLWNQFAYGVTDNFSIGGAIVPLFFFGGAPTPVFISPKFSFPIEKDKFHVGGGLIAVTILGESETGFGILYGLSTFGTPDNNVSFGLGYGFAAGNWASSPMVNFNGMFRLSGRWYFITENYYLNAGGEGLGLLTFGGRWIIKKAALDFGLVVPLQTDIGFFTIPWLGFTVPFGKQPE